jgi:lipid-A-disaccharide synthase
MSAPAIMFVAGEASGDAHVAELIRALRAAAPTLELFGAGGPRMREAGMELTLELTAHAVVGLVEVLKHYGAFRAMFRQLLREAETRRPDAVVLVDYPGFNLRFAAQMKQRGIKVIYYISPQVWAWHAARARQIQRDVDLMLAIFPFEKQWYARHAPGLRVEFVGHPMIDRLGSLTDPVQRDPRCVLLLPGSRAREVAAIFPILAATIQHLPDDLTFVAAAVNDATARMMRHPRVTVEVGGAHDAMRRAALAITASGTATMECALFGCPMLVVYKVNWLTWLVGRSLVKINWLAMPNVIAGREIVPEFLQHRATPQRIAAAARELLDNPARRQTMQRDLDAVVASLGPPGASQRAARLVLREIGLPVGPAP